LTFRDFPDTTTLPPSTFTIEIENSACGIQFQKIEAPQGSKLYGVPITTTITGNTVTFQTTQPATFARDGLLANVTFTTSATSDTCCSAVLLTTSVYAQGCDSPLTRNGQICVLPNNTSVEPLPAAFAFDVYPDPNNGTCFIKMMLEKPASVEFTVVDIFGRTCKTQRHAATIGSNTFALDMANLAPGAYFLTCRMEGRVVARMVTRGTKN
jgi:hypothetical protein